MLVGPRAAGPQAGTIGSCGTRQYSRFQLNRGRLNKGSGYRQRDGIEKLHAKIGLLTMGSKCTRWAFDRYYAFWKEKSVRKLCRSYERRLKPRSAGFRFARR